MFKSKVKATLLHLGLSLLLVGLVFGSLLFFFFPQLFIEVSDFKVRRLKMYLFHLTMWNLEKYRDKLCNIFAISAIR